MAMVKVKQNYQITIPYNLRKKFKIVVGDYMEIEDQEGEEMVLRLVKLVRPDQEYLYTKEWQEGEAQADKDITKGEVIGPFDNIKDGLKALKKAKV